MALWDSTGQWSNQRQDIDQYEKHKSYEQSCKQAWHRACWEAWKKEPRGRDQKKDQGHTGSQTKHASQQTCMPEA